MFDPNTALDDNEETWLTLVLNWFSSSASASSASTTSARTRRSHGARGARDHELIGQFTFVF